jgi:hypothetical protein
METWKIVLAIVIIVIVIIIVRAHMLKAKLAKYGKIRFGCFLNTTNASGLYPLSGEPLVIAQINGRYMVSVADHAKRAILPMKQTFADGVSGYIAIPEMTDTNVNGLTLYVCTLATDAITSAIGVVTSSIQTETKLPIITVGAIDDETAATKWNFNPIEVASMRHARHMLGLATSSMFTELPSKMPDWTASIAGKTGSSFTNMKYSGLTFATGTVMLEPWGDRAFAIHPTGSALSGALIAVPTIEPHVFRIFDMTAAIPNADTDTLEGYTQLTAKDGTSHMFSKNVMDTDSARWKFVSA